MGIPKGFLKLVELVSKESKPQKLEKSLDEIWNNLAYYILIGGDRVDAETGYIYEKLYNSGLLKRSIVRKYDWKKKALSILEKEKKHTLKEKASDKKIGALNKILVELDKIDLTLKGSDRFFDDFPVTPKYLKDISKDRNKTGDFIAKMAYLYSPYKVHGVGYTKAVLWLHSCGLGFDFCPDNNHTKKFLYDDCGFTFKSIDDFYVVMNDVRKLKNKISEILGKGILTIYICGAIYYYKATQNLLPRNLKKEYYPETLINFLVEKNGR